MQMRKKAGIRWMSSPAVPDYSTNLTLHWTPGVNHQGSSVRKTLGYHPTPKPAEMIADAIQDVTKRGDLVFDPFMDSCTTLIAAEID